MLDGLKVVLLTLCLLIVFISCRHGKRSTCAYQQVYDEESTEITIIGSPDTSGDYDRGYLYKELLPIMQNVDSGLLLTRKSYVLSYNIKTKCPNWVAWHLTAEHSEGNTPRTNDYREDLDVPSPRATNEDYKNVLWTRGHMCPAGDNKWDVQAMSETFLLSNMCPQTANLNTGIWNRIEQSCREWAKKYGDLFIVCGPIFLNREHETIGENEVYVPEAFFKVILCIQSPQKAIGFVIRNNDGKKRRDQFVNTIDDVEKITGIDFFSALPDSIENEVESYSNLNDWK